MAALPKISRRDGGFGGSLSSNRRIYGGHEIHRVIPW